MRARSSPRCGQSSNTWFQNAGRTVRGPTSQEFLRTLVLRLPLAEASAKVRTGPPLDDEEDYALGCWAGVIPIHSEYGEPVDDPRLAAGISPPDYVSGYRRPGAGRS